MIAGPMTAFAVGVDNLGDEAAWERLESRWWATRPVHRYSHRQKIESILPLLDDSQSLLDMRHRGHFPNEQAAMRVLYLVATTKRKGRENPTGKTNG